MLWLQVYGFSCATVDSFDHFSIVWAGGHGGLAINIFSSS
jgi:hypothetical protein